MLFSTFAEYLRHLEKTSSRLEITRILAELFKQSSAGEIDTITYLSLGSLAPSFIGLEFNIAIKLMLRILVQTYGREEEEVRRLFKERGDIGDVAFQISDFRFQISDFQKRHSPSIIQVYDHLVTIAREQGTGSVERKIAGFVDLLKKLDPLSVKYVVRIPVGALRLGFSDMTILDALSWMETGDKSLRPALEQAHNVSADIGLIAATFREKGLRGIENLSATPGIPIRPQRAERIKTAEEIIEKLKTPVVEYKLDGFRAQIHLISTKAKNGKKIQEKMKQLALDDEVHDARVVIFSRSMENMTPMFPEIVAQVKKFSVDSIILDGEAIGYDPKTGRNLPFQETIQRKRKHGVADAAAKIPLRYYAFDLLYLNGESLLEQPFSVRRTLMEKLFRDNNTWLDKKTFTISEQFPITQPSELIRLFNESVKKGFEGIMAKKPDSVYRAGARDFTWVKFKHIGKGKLADTLDCVVMGYYAGRGKRQSFGIGAFLVGVKLNHANSEQRIANSEFVTVAKIGTGLSDEQWRQLRQICGKYAVKNKPDSYNVPKNLAPDAWVKPEIVVEIAADELTRSPIHTAGLALRFPRLVRFRDDKKPEDTTTLKEIEKMFSRQ